MDYIAFAIPVFVILMGVELIAGFASKKKYYRFNDALTNLSCGVGSLILGLFFGIATFWAYTAAYEYRFFTIPSNVLTWILLLIGVDFAYYWFHRLSHEINAIWATHIVHHQSEEYNLSVALRQSWFQSFFSWWFYLPLAFLGFTPIMIVTVMAVNTLYQFWIHTKAIKRLPAAIEFIFNTPSHHRVHHGTNPQYIDKNHAGSLIIWDRMFGTFQKEEEEVVYGITSPLNSFSPFYANYHYWNELIHNAKQTDSWKERVWVFVKPPGWFPESMGGFKPAPAVDINNVHKYDRPTTIFAGWYVFVHFMVVVSVTSYYLFASQGRIQEGGWINIFFAFGVAMYIMLSLHVFGLFMENHRRAPVWETVRIAIGLVLVFLFMGNAVSPVLLWSSISFSILSLMILWIFKNNFLVSE